MYRQYPHNGNIGEQQYHLSTDGSHFEYAQFAGPIGGMMSPNVPQSAQHLSPPLRPIATSPSHSRQLSNEPNARYPSKSVSPKIIKTTTAHVVTDYTPTDRSLPVKDVTSESITDAYVAFILYCNPNFALDIDKSTLRTNFQSLPRSDNKDFEVYRLFELIKRFDAKEIKTWGQLALELGVEAPDISKGQSVQKVQQYSVRLKRWMRAMHVDAFFEYLLGKQHAYFQEIPTPDEPYSNARDGVAPEEDLAIRALDPSFRPKRGRRRNSEAEQDQEADTAAENSQTIDQTPFPRSAYPASAYPSANLSFSVSSSTDPWINASAVTPSDFAPWVTKLDGPQSAIATTAPSHMRWQTLATPHPMTALPASMSAHIDAALEPKSAITPSSSRKRRKHGPAVSSAWPSANAPGSKPRGRPPASRNVQDGPFTTFPADPANDKSNPNYNTSSISKRAITEEPILLETTEDAEQRNSETFGRPGRLSLRVPPHTGGPVRLATPPRVMVTNETSESDHSMIGQGQQNSLTYQHTDTTTTSTETAGFGFETLKRTLATDLLRAQMLGRQHRLTGEEAKRLADSILQRLDVPRESKHPPDDVARLTAASWLGLAFHVSTGHSAAISYGKRITVTRIRTDADGYEEIVPAFDVDSTVSRETFDLSWSTSLGSCNGFFELKGLVLAGPVQKPYDVHDAILDSWVETAKRLGIDDKRIRAGKQMFADRTLLPPADTRPVSDDNIDWKAKYQALEFGGRMAKGEFIRYRERLIERVLDTLI